VVLQLTKILQCALIFSLGEQVKSGLRFLGLVIFENKLKPGTMPAILLLRSAHLACRVITSDNPLMAVSVARECGLISEAAHVFTPAFIRGRPHSAHHPVASVIKRLINSISLVARTLPYPILHTKRPTASLVSKEVLTSVIGQAIITTAIAQFWAFDWVRAQTW